MPLETKQICFVPYWIAESLQRRGMGLKLLDNPNELYHYVSMEDLQSIITLNRLIYRDHLAPVSYRPAFNGGDQSIWRFEIAGMSMLDRQKWGKTAAPMTWYNNLFNRNPRSPMANTTVDEHLISMSDTPELVSMLEQRLFREDTRRDQDTHPVIIYDTCLNIIPAVVNPGFFLKDIQQSPQNNMAVKLDAITAVLKALYVHHDHSTVAGTYWYPLYLEALSLHH